MPGIGDMTPEEAAALEASGAPLIAEQQAAAQASNQDGGTDYCHGPNSSWANAVAAGPSGGSAEVAHLFPEGWAGDIPNETRSGTIREQAILGAWLPLFIPEGCDGHVGAHDPITGELLPEVIFYAHPHVASDFDQAFGMAHTSDEVDTNRWNQAKFLGEDASHYTGGAGPNVREQA